MKQVHTHPVPTATSTAISTPANTPRAVTLVVHVPSCPDLVLHVVLVVVVVKLGVGY